MSSGSIDKQRPSPHDSFFSKPAGSAHRKGLMNTNVASLTLDSMHPANFPEILDQQAKYGKNTSLCISPIYLDYDFAGVQ